MKTFAIVILSLDALLLLIWLAGAIYIITQLEVPCFEVQFIVHFLILIHFALATYLASLIGEISKAQQRYYRTHPCHEIQQLPYHFYFPVAWIAVSLVSFIGDIILFTAGIRIYQLRAGLDECQPSRLAHLIFDVVAILISLVSILWFIAFTIYTIRCSPDVRTRAVYK